MTAEQLALARKWVVFLTAVAGLATAIFKPQNHDVTKVSYEELSAGIEKLNVAMAANHDDVVMLRGYVAKMDGERLLVSTVTVADAGVAVPAPAAAGAGAAPSPKRTTPAIFAAPPAPAASAAQPPPVHEAAPQYHPPKFTDVLRMAD